MPFKFTADFTGKTPAGMGPPRDKGVYKVRVVAAEERETSTNKPRAFFTLQVLDKGYAGTTVFDGINIPRNQKEAEKLAPFWLAMLTSLGKPLTKLQRKITISEKSILGNEGYIHFTPSLGESSYPQVKWILAEVYELLVNNRGAPEADGGEVDDDDLVLEEEEEEDEVVVEKGVTPGPTPEAVDDDLDALLA